MKWDNISSKNTILSDECIVSSEMTENQSDQVEPGTFMVVFSHETVETGSWPQIVYGLPHTKVVVAVLVISANCPSSKTTWNES